MVFPKTSLVLHFCSAGKLKGHETICQIVNIFRLGKAMVLM